MNLDEWFGQDLEDFAFKMVLNDKGYGVTITTSLSAPFGASLCWSGEVAPPVADVW